MARSRNRITPQLVEARVGFSLGRDLMRYGSFGALVEAGARTPRGIDVPHAGNGNLCGIGRVRQAQDLRWRRLECVSAPAHSASRSRVSAPPCVPYRRSPAVRRSAFISGRRHHSKPLSSSSALLDCLPTSVCDPIRNPHPAPSANVAAYHLTTSSLSKIACRYYSKEARPAIRQTH